MKHLGNRRDFLRLAAGSTGAGLLLRSDTAGGQTPQPRFVLRFAVASDGHFGQEGTDYETFHREMTGWLNEETRGKGLDFVVFNGDLIHNAPEFLPQVKKAYGRLEVPYYVTKGNHDMVSPAEWRGTWGYEENHSFERGEYAFLLLSTSNQKGEYLCADAGWLQTQLETRRQTKGIFAFLHIAQVKFTRNAVACPKVSGLLESTPNILAVFHGHDHDIDNVIYSNERAYFFDGHLGGNWGTSYRGYRIVEIAAAGQVNTYQCNPQGFYVNGTRLG